MINKNTDLANIIDYLRIATRFLASNISMYFTDYITTKILSLEVTNTEMEYNISGLVGNLPMNYKHVITVNGNSPESYCWGSDYTVHAGTSIPGGTTMHFTLILVKYISGLTNTIVSDSSDVQTELSMAKTDIEKLRNNS